MVKQDMMKCELGSVVQSLAGKDKDKLFIVSNILNEQYVHLVDGKNRTLLNPKKKKIKHLIVCQEKSELKEKFEQAQYLLDSDIRKVLKTLK